MERSEKAILKDEEEANLFAVELLIPYEMIMEDLKDIKYTDYEDDGLVSRLAKKYVVSNQAMLFRILQVTKEKPRG